MLLLQGERAAVVSWVHRGRVPAHVVPLEGWTAVLPAGPSRAASPYDDSIKLLAGRPVASRLRSAIGLFAAIPAVIAYNRFARQIDRIATQLESFIEEFSNILQRNAGAMPAMPR